MNRFASPLLALLALSFGNLTVSAVAQDWTPVAVGTTADLHALNYGLSTAYVAGDDGFLASSPDLVNWTPVSLGTTADFLSLLQPSDGQVWVGGAAGTVRVLTSGTWNTRDVPDASQDYVLTTASSSEAVAIGSGGSLWKGTVFGQNWTLQHSAGVPLHGGTGGRFAVGDGGTILKSQDNGYTWAPRPSGTTAALYGIQQGGSGTFFAVGENGTLLRSTDDGETWSPRLSGTARTLRAVATWGSAVTIAVGDDGVVLKSTDQGETWCRLSTGQTADLYDAAALNLSDYYVLGQGGLFLRTTTGGGTCSPAVDATITRIGTGDIPAGGGPLTFRVTLQNPTTEPQTVQAWVDALLPSGSPFGPFLGPKTVTLNPGQTVGSITYTKHVPANAPAGLYTVRLRVGAFGTPPLLHDEATFQFTKSASAPREGDGARAPMTPADWGAAAFAEAGIGTSPTPSLSAVRPNPARGTAALTLTADRAQRVTAAVYDVQGRRVATVFEGEAAAGVPFDLALDVRGLAPGVYVVRVRGETFAESRRLVVVR